MLFVNGVYDTSLARSLSEDGRVLSSGTRGMSSWKRGIERVNVITGGKGQLRNWGVSTGCRERSTRWTYVQDG